MQTLNSKNFIKLYEHYSSKINISERIKYCDNAYLRLIDDIIVNFNTMFNVKWSKKAWEIFIGPYIHRYVSVVYDRYLFLNSLKKKFKKKKINKIYLSSKREDLLKNIEEINWNYSLILLINDSLDKKNLNEYKFKIKNYRNRKANFFKNNNFFIFLKLFYYIFRNSSKILIYRPYWDNRWEILKLFFKLNVFPFLYNFEFNSSNTKNISNWRYKKFQTKYKQLDRFERLLRNIFYHILPKFYLEDFKELKDKSRELTIFSNIKKIYSSQFLHEDSIFKFWLSDNYHKGIEIFYSQHGMNYGMAVCNHCEFLEVKLSDYFLTWGWKKKNNVKVIPFFSTKKFLIKKIYENNNNKILIVNTRCFNFLVENHSDIYFGKKSLNYCTQVLNLLKLISKNEKFSFDIRNSPNENEFNYYNLESLIKKKYKNFLLIDKKIKLKNIIGNYKIIINTYLSTTFLECLNSNIPSLLILDINKSTLNLETKNFLYKLEKHGIVHQNNKKLINFINNLEQDINHWWNSDKLQIDLKKFCNNFSRITKSLSTELSKKLL